jgi:hypothetical protein
MAPGPRFTADFGIGEVRARSTRCSSGCTSNSTHNGWSIWIPGAAVAVFTTSLFVQCLAHIADASAYKNVQIRSGTPVSGRELFQKNHQVLVSALEDWNKSLDGLVAIPSGASSEPDRDNCVRSALSVTDESLRLRAIAACNR